MHVFYNYISFCDNNYKFYDNIILKIDITVAL